MAQIDLAQLAVATVARRWRPKLTLSTASAVATVARRWTRKLTLSTARQF